MEFWPSFHSLPHRRNSVNFHLSPSVKQRGNPCSGPPPVFRDLRKRHDYPDNKFIVNVLIKLRVNTKGISINSLSPLGAKTKDVPKRSKDGRYAYGNTGSSHLNKLTKTNRLWPTPCPISLTYLAVLPFKVMLRLTRVGHSRLVLGVGCYVTVATIRITRVSTIHH